MSINSFGRLLRMTTWGESHGPAIGCVVDGCPPGLALDEAHVQCFLDERRPGGRAGTTPRSEPDRVRILSGVYRGQTTGTPIALQIENVDRRSTDYPDQAPYRPGHADFAYDRKYGLRDPRGGGRASARETVMRVAAGAIARLVIPEVTIAARLVEMGGEADPARWDDMIADALAAGDSLGGIVACRASGVPAGWGAPIYAKLDADLAAACMGINAAKGVDIGDGFAAARQRGSESRDAMARAGDGKVAFEMNHAGGIVGGISTGQDLLLRVAFKATSSITTSIASVDAAGNDTVSVVKGRHDACVALRAGPIVEAMVALVLADHKLLHRGQCG